MEIYNSSHKEVSVVGNELSCACIRLEPGIVSLPPLKITKIPMKLKPVGNGRFHHRVRFFLDHSQQDRLVVDVSGFIVLREEILQ